MRMTVLCGAAAGLCVASFAQDARPWSANPKTVEEQSRSRPGINFDETKVPRYRLPDALKMGDGAPVTSAALWETKRRAELLELFRREVYGRRPEARYTLAFRQTAAVAGAFDGAATGRSITATVTAGGRSFEFPFVVFVPNRVQGKVPAVVHINNRYFTPLERALEKSDPFWPVRTLVKRGYATASFYTSNVDPDEAGGYQRGIRSFLADGKPPAGDAWRALSAWGWAASRLLDYLETLDAVDAARVAVGGHSRGGKASLWAAAEDRRFAVAYSNDSGCGGAALSRRAFGETVEQITKRFPHWFSPALARYSGREDELPIDQHELIGLIAPRGVYVASAGEDLWADPKGEYASLVAAAPVFALLGKQSIREEQMPAINQPRVVGQTGYHIRTGGHGWTDQDWDWFLDFADRLLK
ncbi:MAG: hypothetical protein IT159_09400 [Bryobacterales bacterium]|nr:hypothetical protein [Bryobacterales bacterium]